MFEDQEDPRLMKQEKNFQKMLVNNMESVFKIFFRGMSCIRVKPESMEEAGDGPQQKKIRNSFSLASLSKNKIVQTRIRADTGVKQYHAG